VVKNVRWVRRDRSKKGDKTASGSQQESGYESNMTLYCDLRGDVPKSYLGCFTQQGGQAFQRNTPGEKRVKKEKRT